MKYLVIKTAYVEADDMEEAKKIAKELKDYTILDIREVEEEDGN